MATTTVSAQQQRSAEMNVLRKQRSLWKDAIWRLSRNRFVGQERGERLVVPALDRVPGPLVLAALMQQHAVPDR